MKLLIQAGADVNMAEDKGFTPLINAARNDHGDCVDLLIQAGANVNQAAVKSITPIIGAAVGWTPNCLQKLILAGADVNAIRYRGRIALLECVWDSQKWHDDRNKGDGRSYVERKCKQKECVEIFIKAGANVNAQTDYGISVLMKASENGYEECVKLLLEAGADVNATCKDGCTSLIYSAMFGRKICTFDLLAAGADVNAYCKRGRTPLIYSAMYSYDACLGLIITAGADVNRKDDDVFTALMRAAFYGNFKCVKMLLQAGADVNFKEDKRGITALFQASCYDRHANVCNYTKNTQHVFVPDDHSASKCVETLIEAGADVNVVNILGETVLKTAAMNVRNILVFKHLLKANCRVNMMDGYSGRSALTSYILYGYGHLKNIAMLLFAAGEIVAECNKKRLQNILKLEDPGIQLKHICREAIRKHLLDVDIHTNLFCRIPRLGLPERMNQYLLYGESLDDDNYDADGLQLTGNLIIWRELGCT